MDTPTVSESAPASFTLNAAVRNQGNGRSDSTTLRYYQSTDSTITTGDTAVGTDFVFRLDAAESGAESISVTAPSMAGTYYYGACVDSVSDESDTTNNCSAAVTVTVGAAPAPDLVVDTPTVSESAPAAGASFTLNAAVRNQGNGSSDSTTLRYYRSADSTITTGDTAVGTDSVFRLDAAESGAESISVTAPDAPGTYYYGACVDSGSDESDTTNNCSAAVTVTVGAAPAPDLVVDTPTVSESAPAAGASFTLNAAVRNQGNGRSDSTTLRYYQSTDSTITTGDTAVGTDFVFRLDAAESGAESISVTAPSMAGTYYYGACVDSVSDESDTTNNCSAAVTVTVGAAPAPDLVVDTPTVDTPTVSESAPAAGASFTLNAAVRNQGNGSSDSTTLRYYRSADSTITTGDTAVGTDFVFRLDAAESGAESISVTAPSMAGTYYYGACVDSVSDESDTTNNCSAAVTVTVGAAPAPDLVVDTPTVSESAPAAGASFTLNAAVRNQGNGSSDSTTLRYYRSADSTITTGDTAVGTDFVFRLDAAESGAESISVTAPSTAGTYYYGACVDAVSDESDTTNNCSATVTVTVGAAPAPDVVLSTPRVSASTPTAGASFNLSVTAENQGSASSQPTTLRFYRSTDSTISSSDTQLGTHSVPILGPGGGFIANENPTAPTSPGMYYYGACVDAVSDESDTTNNCSAAVTVIVGASASVPGAPTALTANPDGQTEIDLSWTAPSNDGGANITGYRIEVSTNGSSWSDLVANTRSTSTSYSHTGLTAGSTRHYRVSAINSAGTGTASNTANTTTSLAIQGSPDLVVDNTLLGANVTPGYHLSLNATVNNQGDGPSAPTTLRYYHSPDAMITTSDTQVGTDQVDRLVPSGSISHASGVTVSSTPGTYYYGACVDTVPGESDAGNNCSTATEVTVRVVNSPPEIVGDIDDVTVTLGERFQVDISGVFSEPDGEDVQNYGFTLKTKGILSGSVNTQTGILSLRAIGVGATTVAVEASDIHGNGSGTHDLFVVTVVPAVTATAPGTPTGLTAAANGQTQIDLSWTAPSDNGRAAVTGYRIEVSPDGSSWSDLVANTNSTTTSYSHTGLTAGSTRHYRVSAINSAGTGTASNTANATTDSPQPPPTPRPTGTAVTGQVTDCSGEQVAPGIDSYRVTITGTLSASRAVENVTVTGKFSGEFVGIDVVGDMTAGESASFSITGYVSESVGTCGAEVEWLEIT